MNERTQEKVKELEREGRMYRRAAGVMRRFVDFEDFGVYVNPSSLMYGSKKWQVSLTPNEGVEPHKAFSQLLRAFSGGEASKEFNTSTGKIDYRFETKDMKVTYSSGSDRCEVEAVETEQLIPAYISKTVKYRLKNPQACLGTQEENGAEPVVSETQAGETNEA